MGINLNNDLAEEFNRWRLSQGLPPVASFQGPKRPRTITMTDEGYNSLRRMAIKFGYRSSKGRAPEFPQEVPGAGVSEFLEAIASGLYSVEVISE